MTREKRLEILVQLAAGISAAGYYTMDKKFVANVTEKADELFTALAEECGIDSIDL